MLVVPLKQAAALATVIRMAMAQEMGPMANKEHLLMGMDHQAKKIMHLAMEMHSRQMVQTVETPLAMAPHREEMVEPQLGQREPRVMLGEREATQLLEVKTTQAILPEVLLRLAQILAQEMEMGKQTKMDPIKMALTEHRRTRMEEIPAPGHQIQLVTQPALATLSASTTNALRFRTRHLVAPPPAASYISCGGKRHQPVSQGLPASIMSVYLRMDLSTAAHQASIVQSITLVYKIPVWLSVTQHLAAVRLAAAMKSVLATSAHKVLV